MRTPAIVIAWDQAAVLSVLAASLGLFLWGRIRYDIVAVIALLTLTAMGIVPAATAFEGFGHPAVITVAAMLMIARALRKTGAADRIARLVGRAPATPEARVLTFTGLTAACSAFMNNIGACALFAPVAMRDALERKEFPSRILMPISFASLLGGLVTLIGTPPNIIIATFRGDATGEAFGMFDFTPVGLMVAMAGIAYLTSIGWRLLPKNPPDRLAAEDFKIEDYIAELAVPDTSPVAGKPVAELDAIGAGDIAVVALCRGSERILAPSGFVKIRADDVLIVEADSDVLDRVMREAGLEFLGDASWPAEQLRSKDVSMIEAVVAPGTPIDGRTPRGLRLHTHYGVNLLAISRRGKRVTSRLGAARFEIGDVLLLQGERRNLPEALAAMGCVPLASRPLDLMRRGPEWQTVGIFGAAIALTAAGVFPVHVSFPCAVLSLIAVGALTLNDIYAAVEWPIVVLLGAFIGVGEALDMTGGALLIAGPLLALAETWPTWTILTLLMVATMLLSDVINNAATAVLMAPIGLKLAEGLGLSPDPFLMAVAIGASSTFLTPVGHQSNLLVMGPGGYKFNDYFPVGLPLDAIIVAVAIPMILLVWPI